MPGKYAVRRIGDKVLHRHARRMRRIVIVIVCLAAAGCTSGGSPSSAGVPSAVETTGAPAPSAAASAPASEEAGAAPDELAGTWRRVVFGEEALLTLAGNGYNITRAGNIGSGAIEVVGDQIRFYGSSLCDGEGIYAWTIEEGRLRLTEVQVDPCTGRSEVFLRGTLGRVDP
jgi:hypothetical protein